MCNVAGAHRNAMATIDGSQVPRRHLIVSAHLDSRTRDRCDATSFAPGADDDGSGVAAVLEMGRLLGPVATEATVILMTVTGEEQGLFGSTAFAEDALKRELRIDGVVNNDLIGSPSGCADPACPPESPRQSDPTSARAFSEGPATSAHRQLTRAMKRQARRYVPEFTVNLIPALDRPGRGGDHTPFSRRGFAAMRFTEAFEDGDGSGRNGHQHNETDTIDQVDFDYLAAMTRVNLAGLANLALAPESPPTPTVTVLITGGLNIAWPRVSTAQDLAGYRVALRHAQGDTLDYFEVRDVVPTAGPVQSTVLDGRPAGEEVYVSVAAYDRDGNESILGRSPGASAFGGAKCYAYVHSSVHDNTDDDADRDSHCGADADASGTAVERILAAAEMAGSSRP